MQTMQESQLHSTGCHDSSRVSAWTELLLEQYFIVRKGHLHRITEYPELERTQGLSNPALQLHARIPFCRTPSLFILFQQSTSSPSLWQAAFCFPHDCSGMCFHNDIIVGWEDGGTILKFITASIQGRWPALTQIYSVWMSAGASDTQ